MRPVGCVAARRAAPELALDVLDGAERAEVLDHLARCARCLAYVAELAEMTDQLVGLAPDLEPPAGFGPKVIEQITHSRRHTRGRWGPAVAAGAAVVVILVIAAGEIRTPGAAHPVLAAPLRSVPMLGPAGITVGHVALSGASPTRMAVGVDYAVPDGTYALELQAPSTPRRQLATITIADGYGQWEGVTKLGGHDTTSLLLVGSHDTIVCHAAIT